MASKFKISSVFQAIDKITGPTKKMQKSVTGFSKSTQRSFGGMNAGIGKMRGLITGVVAAITTGAIVKGINDFAKQGDEISKTARQIGLTAEALQELQFAAERQGISTEDFTKSMQKMNKNIGEAKAGTGSMITLLNKTNPALLEQMKNVENSEQAFDLLIQEIESLPNQMEKAALANAAFGKSGKNMLILAEGGTEAVKALREEARKYGGVMSDEAARDSERFVDALTNVKAAVSGVRNMIMSRLIPAIEPIIQKIAEWFAKNKEIIKQKFDQTINKIASFLKKAFQIIKKLMPFLKIFVPIIAAIIVAYKAWAVIQGILNVVMNLNPIGLIIMAIAGLIAGIVLLVKNWDKVKAALIAFWGKIKEFVGFLWSKVVGAFKTVRDWIFKAFDNPIIAGIATILAPFISIPILIAKNWELIKEAVGKAIDWIAGAIDTIIGPIKWIIEKVGKIFGKKTEIKITNEGVPMSPNAGIIESRRYEENRSTADVYFHDVPPGTRIKQTGKAPNINLPLGLAGGLAQ